MVPQPRRDKSLRFRLFRFRSPLLTESLSLSIPADTEMFHFSACRSFASIDSTRTWHCFHNVGLPHSETSGSKRVCRSPELIAAYCVLHSLMTPRHPSIALLVLVSNSEILGVQLTYVTRKNPFARLSKNKIHSASAVRLGGSHASAPIPGNMVGPDGLEPSTPRLSSACSNQLSYEPKSDGGADRI